MKKIRVNNKMKAASTSKTFPFPRKTLAKNIWFAGIIFLTILIILSAYTTLAAFQQPTQVEESVPTYGYTHTAKFSYIAYLTNNTIYNKSILLPGQGTIFKKITDHIDATLTYTFNTAEQVSGFYSIKAEVQTDLWTKRYTITPQTYFYNSSFIVGFPIDFSYFESIVAKINDETGVTASDPRLTITCDISTTAKTYAGMVYESFSPTLSVPLGANTISIEGDLSQSADGVITTTILVDQPEVFAQRNNMMITTILLVVIFSFYLLLTKGEVFIVSKMDKIIKKIMKKYGEWIVEASASPEDTGAESIIVKTFEDLVKTSEELGRPIVHVSVHASPVQKHLFYVFDETVQYEFVIDMDD